MTKEQLKNRTKKFALDVFKFLSKLEKNKANLKIKIDEIDK
jgi:hypothetical protein